MKGKAILGVLAVMGILALSATVAQASGGGTPSALMGFFVCHSINGDDAAQVVDVEANVLGPARKGVKIGNGTLACAFAKLLNAGTEAAIDPGPPTKELKCYGVSVARKVDNPQTRFDATDALFGDTEGAIQASELRYICGPATFFISP